MGIVLWFLGINLLHKEEEIYVTQTLFINNILERFNLQNSKTINPVPLSKDVDFKQLLFPIFGYPLKYFPYRYPVGFLFYPRI